MSQCHHDAEAHSLCSVKLHLLKLSPNCETETPHRWQFCEKIFYEKATWQKWLCSGKDRCTFEPWRPWPFPKVCVSSSGRVRERPDPAYQAAPSWQHLSRTSDCCSRTTSWNPVVEVCSNYTDNAHRGAGSGGGVDGGGGHWRRGPSVGLFCTGTATAAHSIYWYTESLPHALARRNIRNFISPWGSKNKNNTIHKTVRSNGN